MIWHKKSHMIITFEGTPKNNFHHTPKNVTAVFSYHQGRKSNISMKRIRDLKGKKIKNKSQGITEFLNLELTMKIETFASLFNSL